MTYFYSLLGIGVPIMLAYVYGVVPISLCRSGGCGVSAGNGKGVRIEFDDENDINVGGANAAIGESADRKGHISILLSPFTRPHRVQRRLPLPLLSLLSSSLSSLTLRQGLTV